MSFSKRKKSFSSLKNRKKGLPAQAGKSPSFGIGDFFSSKKINLLLVKKTVAKAVEPKSLLNILKPFITVLVIFNLTVVSLGLYSVLMNLNLFSPALAAPFTYSEDFTTTTYKDAGTTANWDTSVGQGVLANGVFTQATAAAGWTGREGATTVSFNNKIWVLGGYSGVSFLNDVWSSSDGVTWSQETAAAGWGARYDHTSLVFNSKIWVIGGCSVYNCAGGRYNDVWSSSNGISWTQETAAAGWSARGNHASVVFNSKMWVMGGFGTNDVWSSSDGISWTQETAAADWSARSLFPATVFDSKIWIFGGTQPVGGSLDDVWYSANGVNWTQATASGAWGIRYGHTAATFDSKMWIMGGFKTGGSSNDVWYSTNGVAWTQFTTAADWAARRYQASTVFDNGTGDKIWVLGGETAGGDGTDVWYKGKYKASGILLSGAVDSTADNIITATLTANTTTNSQTVTYELSANNGSNWCAATSGVAVNFTTCSGDVRGASLLWRATLSTTNTSVTPIVENLTIGYSTKAITVTNPSNATPNAEKFVGGATEAIIWTTSNPVTIANVKIEYSGDGGGTWSIVIASTTNDGNYLWTVGSTTTDSGLIRISDVLDSTMSDTSDAVFSIVSATLQTYDFGTSGDYTLSDGTKVEVSGGYGALLAGGGTGTATDTTLDFDLADRGNFVEENTATGTDLHAGLAMMVGDITNSVYGSGNIWVSNNGSSNVSKLSAPAYGNTEYTVGTTPIGVAVDQSGNIWVANSGTDNVSKLDASASYAKTDYATGDYPQGVAVDQSGDIWVANTTTGNVSKLDASAAYAKTDYVTGGSAYGVAVDQSGNIWVTNYDDGNVSKLDASDSYNKTNYTVGTNPRGVAVDQEGDIWVANSGSSNVSKLDASAAYARTNYAVDSTPSGIAVDQRGNIWVSYYTGSNNVSKLDASAAYAKTEYAVGTTPFGVAVDKAGNIWVANPTSSNVSKLDASATYTRTNYTAGTTPAGFGDMTGHALALISGTFSTAQSYYLTTSNANHVDVRGWASISSSAITQTTPTNTSLKYLVSFDSRTTWKYWDGSAWQTASAGLTHSDANGIDTLGMTSATLTGLSTANWAATGGFTAGTTQYIDLAVNMATTNTKYSPTVDQITFTYVPNYTSTSQTIINTTSFPYYQISSFSASVGSSNIGTVEFQISADDGTTWKYWDGAAWSTVTGLTDANTDDEITTNIAAWNTSFTNGGFKFKAILQNTGAQYTQLDRVNIGYTALNPIASPNGGETYVPTATELISWDSTTQISGITNVKIEYSLDGGTTYTVLSASTANDGRYYWTIPSTFTTTGIVRISDATPRAYVYDVSATAFSIVDATLKTYNFATTTDYTYDATKIDMATVGGYSYSQLKGTSGGADTPNTTINFTTEGNYTQEDATNGTDFSSGLVKLKATVGAGFGANAVFDAKDIIVANVGSSNISWLDQSAAYAKTDKTAGTNPNNIAVAANGDVFVAHIGSNSIIKYTYPTYASSTSYNVGAGQFAIAIDTSGNLWYGASNNVNCLTTASGFTSACANTPIAVGGGANVYSIIFDQSNNLWFSPNNGNAYCYTAASVYTAQCTSSPYAFGAAGAAIFSMAVDTSGNVWGSDVNEGKFFKFTIGASPVTYTPAGVSNPAGLDLDDSGNIWIADYAGGAGNKVYCFTVADPTVQCAGSPYTVGSIPVGLGVDKDNNVWVVNDGSGTVTCLDYPTYAACAGSPFTVGTLTGGPGSVAYNLGDFTGRKLATASVPTTYPNGPFYVSTNTSSQINTLAWYGINSVGVTSTAGAGTTLKYLVSFDNGTTWKYWTGSAWATAGASGLAAKLAANGMTEATLEGLAAGDWDDTGGFAVGTLDFAVSLATTDTSVTPNVDLITVNYSPSNYSAYNAADPPTISNTAAQAKAYRNMLAFSEIKGSSHATSAAIEYQISNNGTTWYYWNGSAWTATTGANYPTETNTALEISQNIATIATGIGTGSFYFKAHLVSGSLAQLENINIGYASTGQINPLLTNPPAVPTIGTPEALSSTSIRWNFTDNAQNETGFAIQNSQGVTVASSPAWATIDLEYLDERGLSPNTEYSGRYAVAFNSHGYSVPSESANAVFTLANIPGAPTLATINPTTLKLTFNLNANPPGTELLVHETTTNTYLQANGTLGATPVWRSYTAWNAPEITGLTPNSQYTFEVKARNGNTIETAYSPTRSITSGVAPVVNISLSKSVGINVPIVAGFSLSLMDSLRNLSGLTNYALALAVLLSLALTLALLQVSDGTKRLREQLKLVPSILFRHSSKSFAETANRDDGGTYLHSYAEHKKYHNLVSSSFFGALTLSAAKVAIIASLAFITSAYAANTYLDDGRTVNPSDQIVYKLDYANLGGSATSVVITDTLNSSLVYQVESVRVVKNNTSQTPSVTFANNTLTWNIGSLATGDTGYALFQAQVKPTAPAKTSITNQARLTATEISSPILSNTTTNQVVAKATPVLPEATITLTAPALTSDNTPTLTGKTSDAKQSVDIYLDSVKIATVTSGATGSFTYTLTAHPDGTYKVEARVGATSSGAKTMTIDTTAPTAPVITSVRAVQEKSSNYTTQGGTTAVRLEPAHLIIKGTSTADTKKITFYIHSTEIIETFNPSGTSWTYTTGSNNFDVGSHTVFAKGTDLAGNISTPSNEKGFAITTETVVPPVVPPVTPVTPATPVVPPTTPTTPAAPAAPATPAPGTPATPAAPAAPATGAGSATATGGGVSSVPFTGTFLDQNVFSAIWNALPGSITGNETIQGINDTIFENDLAKQVRKVTDNPKVERTTQNIIVPSVVSFALAMTMPAISLIQLLPYLQYLFTQPILLIGRRKRKGYGTIYNSLTKMPVDLAIVRLYDEETKKLVQTRVTDRQGRYSFIAQPGKYYISVTKPGFAFPTSYLKNRDEDVKYVDLYHGGSFEAVEEKAVVTMNIPIDPAEKMVPSKKIVFTYLLRRLQRNISFIGIILAALSFIIAPTFFVLIILGVHIILYGLFKRLAYAKRPKSWGIVYDAATKKPLGLSITRIFDKEFNKLLETQVTDRLGRYSFLVGQNVYYVTAEKDGYQKIQTSHLDLTRPDREAVIGEDLGLNKA